MKRLIALLLVLVLCMVPSFSMAEEGTQTGDENVLADEQVEAFQIGKVTGVKVSCTRNNDVTVKWKAVKGADIYRVYRWNSSKKKYVLIGKTEKLSYVNKNMISAKRYVYKVAAVKGETEGKKSEKKAIHTYVKRVTGLKVSCRTITNNVNLSWSKVKGATGYKVYRWSKKKQKYVLIKNTSKCSYTDKSKASKKKYWYKVAAYQTYKTSKGKKVTKRGLKSKSRSVKTYGKYHGVSLAKPLESISVCSSYGWRWGRMHKGTDMRASTGTPIYAAADGTVTTSHGTVNSMGVTIKIRHSNGVTTTYGHMSRRYAFKGEKVKAGECIGLVGSTGNASCSHLHFEVRINGSTVNPMGFY